MAVEAIVLQSWIVIIGAFDPYSDIKSQSHSWNEDQLHMKEDLRITVKNMTVVTLSNVSVGAGGFNYVMSCTAPFPVKWTMDTYHAMRVRYCEHIDELNINTKAGPGNSYYMVRSF